MGCSICVSLCLTGTCTPYYNRNILAIVGLRALGPAARSGNRKHQHIPVVAQDPWENVKSALIRFCAMILSVHLTGKEALLMEDDADKNRGWTEHPDDADRISMSRRRASA